MWPVFPDYLSVSYDYGKMEAKNTSKVGRHLLYTVYSQNCKEILYAFHPALLLVMYDVAKP